MPGLPEFIRPTKSERGFATADRSKSKLTYRVTPTVIDAMRERAATRGGTLPEDDPLRLQFIPRSEELVVRPEERADPLGEEEHSPLPRLVHRYTDRVLLLVTDACAVHCRYCFRSRFTGTSAGTITDEDLGQACDYIRSGIGIREVILSGGDPLTVPVAGLVRILDRIRSALPDGVIRIASRVPVVDPPRISADLAAALSGSQPVWIVLQVNHPAELQVGALQALRRLADTGTPLLSQTVLLRGVNDDAGVLEDLFTRLVRWRVKPYYLFQADLAPGTSHFRVDLDRALAIVDELRGRVSGLSMPVFSVDIPGGAGKVRLEPSALVGSGDDGFALRAQDGIVHRYPRGDL